MEYTQTNTAGNNITTQTSTLGNNVEFNYIYVEK